MVANDDRAASYFLTNVLGLRVHFPGAPWPLQENKINKN